MSSAGKGPLNHLHVHNDKWDKGHDRIYGKKKPYTATDVINDRKAKEKEVYGRMNPGLLEAAEKFTAITKFILESDIDIKRRLNEPRS